MISTSNGLWVAQSQYDGNPHYHLIAVLQVGGHSQ
jgi:hypothetical protein